MTEFKRQILKTDPVMNKLLKAVISGHKVADHEQKTLNDNRHVKDFCVESRHFVYMRGNTDLYIHYDTSSWYNHPNTALVRIDCIAVYDDFIEYEKARVGQRARLDMFDNVMSALHATPAREQLGAMAPDIAYEITRKLRDIDQNQPKPVDERH